MRLKIWNMSLRFFLPVLLCTAFFVSPAQKKKKRRKAKIEHVISTGKSYIGTPYKWGGNTKAGIDCSGLIHNSYKTIGIKLPRTAKEQSKVGKKRGWEGIRRGDLVYFKFKKKGEKWFHSGMITHVSDEKILFVHASSSRIVRSRKASISSLLCRRRYSGSFVWP
ncbi:MAG: NlpC/P60 family protein, partial [Bacteroidota bacterium]